MKLHKLAWLILIPLIVFGCLVVPTATLADTFDEGIIYSLSTVTAGDVVLCETASPCDATNTSNWSDVLVFYNSETGPFKADSSFDANSAFVFSDDASGIVSLAGFLALYNGLSSNAQFIVENPTGPTSYLNGQYLINSATATPEPGTLASLGFGLLALSGLGVLKRR